MLLSNVTIKYFRGIEELSLPLDKHCVLIGENNTGKSSVLDAIRTCLTRSVNGRGAAFDEYDYHLEGSTAEPSKSEPIEITLEFKETTEDEWPAEVSQILRDAVQVDGNLSIVRLRVTSSFNPQRADFITDYDFLNLSDQPLPNARNLLPALRRLAPTYYLASLRDAAKEFQARSPFWRPFVRASGIDDNERKQLERELSVLNDKILKQHTKFDDVKKQLEKTADVMPLGDKDPVSIDAVPSKVFDILSRTKVNFASKTGAQIPIVRHGSGTQSLAVICLFEAFLKSQENNAAEPLLALEEPEAHLHPSAIKAVGKMLQEFPGQKLVSTHSGDLLAGTRLQDIRRLRRTCGKITVHRVEEGTLTAEEVKRLDYQIRTSRGSLFFSRCWLLVEGQTEGLLLPECARVMGHDLVADGVSCVEFANVGVDKFIKVADELGIEWLVFADDDTEGRNYKQSAVNQLNGRDESEHIRDHGYGNIELFLCMEGFGEIYEASVSDQKRHNIDATPGEPEYWPQVIRNQARYSKTRNALLVTEKMMEKGTESIPGLLREIVEQTRELARRAE